MALNDYTYRLKAVTGQSSPVDELGGSTLTGSTQTLIDRGSGDCAWRFAVGQAIATLPTKAINNTAGNGCTLVVKGRYKNYGTLDYNVALTFGNASPGANDTSAGQASGLVSLARVAAGSTQWAEGPSHSYLSGRTTTIDVEFTMVLILRDQYSGGGGFDRLEAYYNGGSGTTPDQVSGGVVISNFNITTLTVNASNSTVIEFSDIVFYPNEKTATEARALANGPRAAIDAATINLAGSNCSQSATSGTGSVTVTPAGGGTVNLVGSNCTQAATSGTGAVSVTPPPGTITSDEFRNYSNILQTGVTIPVVPILKMDGTIAVTLTNQVTNGAGKLVITNAAMTVGTAYMLATWDATDTNADTMKRGLKKYTAA